MIDVCVAGAAAWTGSELARAIVGTDDVRLGLWEIRNAPVRTDVGADRRHERAQACGVA